MIRFLAGVIAAACALAAVNTLHGNPPLQPFTSDVPSVRIVLTPAATATPTAALATLPVETVPSLVPLPHASPSPGGTTVATPSAPSPSLAAIACPAFWIPWQGGCVPPEPVVEASATEPTIARVTWTPPPGWSAQECQTAVTMLAWDEALDQKSSLTDPTYYSPVVLEWADLEGYVWSSCRTGRPMTALQAGEGSNWVALAISTHYFDVRDHAGDAAWDDQWVTAYAEIAAMLRVAL